MVFSFRFLWLCNSKHTEGVPMAQLFATGIYTTLWTLPRRAENDSQTRNPHETKSHERTEFLVTRNQGKHPDRGCAKASHDDRISGRGELDRASPKKCAKNSGRYRFSVPLKPWKIRLVLFSMYWRVAIPPIRFRFSRRFSP